MKFVDALATHRITRLITTDSILNPVRQALYPHLPAKVKEGLACDWCVSVWVGAGVVLTRRFIPRAWDPLAQMLALSSVAGLVSNYEYLQD